MAQIQDFPIEILVEIFDIIYSSCWRNQNSDVYSSDSSDDEDESVYLEWVSDEPLRSAARFPFNVAKTCQKWRDIALNSPEYWKSLVFDLADDPDPFLHTFEFASRRTLFPLVVFTTSKEDSESWKALENARARRVIQHLMPHAHRCTSIVFELTFASSLPSAASLIACNSELTNLTLDYVNYDMPLCFRWEQTHQLTRSPVPYKLETMSLNGSSFIDMLHLGKDWLQSIKVERVKPEGGLDLCIKDFQFPCPGNDIEHEEYSLENFLFLLRCFVDRNDSVCFENLSLAYHPPAPKSEDLPRTCYVGHNKIFDFLEFKSVSQDFLTDFFLVSQLEIVNHRITFEQCSIPHFSLRLYSFALMLIDIPGRESVTHEEDSLHNILSSWKGPSLHITACPGFNDEIIALLVEIEQKALNAYDTDTLISVMICDCPNFSFAALRELISTCDRVPFETNGRNMHEDYVIKQIHVTGRQPPLRKADLQWFRTTTCNVTVHIDTVDGHNYVFGRQSLDLI